MENLIKTRHQWKKYLVQNQLSEDDLTFDNWIEWMKEIAERK